MSKKIRDETIIDALLISATVRSAAAKLDINEQTIYRRKRDAEFMRKYSEARRERTEAARNMLQERAHAAAEILRQNVKYTEITDVLKQLSELEAWRKEQENR